MVDGDAANLGPTTKQQWRTVLRARLAERRSHGPGVNSFSGIYAHHFLFRAGQAYPPVLLTYAAGPDEIPTADFHALARTVGFELAYPVCEDDDTLNFYRVAGFTELVPDRYGIPTPAHAFRIDARRVDPKDVRDILVPGLGFDEHTGIRLGRGGGYYDRFLARCPNALRIGVAFDEQVVTGLPAEPHDIPMHAVVTPTRTLRFP